MNKRKSTFGCICQNLCNKIKKNDFKTTYNTQKRRHVYVTKTFDKPMQWFLVTSMRNTNLNLTAQKCLFIWIQ